MKKYFRLSLLQLNLAWQKTIEYRQNFFIWSCVDVGWAVMDILFFSILVGNIQTLGGWNLGQAMMVLGLQRLLSLFVWGWMWSSFNQLPRLISQGKLDMYLVKPVDSQFGVSTLNFSFSLLPSLVTGIGFMVYSSLLLRLTPTLIQLVSFFWLGVVSLVLIYGVYFASMSTIMFFDRLGNLAHIFTSLFDATKYPKEIFPGLIQRVTTTAIPVSLMVIVPAESLFKNPSWALWIWLHILAFIFIITSRRIWLSGIRRYSSASS